MDQAQLELQLKVWKELAISKQVLMRSAAEALKLNPDCTQDELKQALETTLKKIAQADASVIAAQEQAKQTVLAMERKLAISTQAQTAAETTMANMIAKQERLAPQMAADRAAVAKELQQLKEKLAEKEKALKAINTALADTPDNVLKKMKTLKKEKQEEADACRRVEVALSAVRKEKKEQDQKLTELREDTNKLMTRYRDLHAAATTLQEKAKATPDDKETPAIPELDTELLEGIENPESKKKDKDKEKEPPLKRVANAR